MPVVGRCAAVKTSFTIGRFILGMAWFGVGVALFRAYALLDEDARVGTCIMLAAAIQITVSESPFLKRIWLRIVCQFRNHDVPDFQSFSCYCRRCHKGWHPETYFRGPLNQAPTIRNVVVQAYRYLFSK